MNQLQRHLGLTFLILYGVGDILGAGVYGLVGKAAGQMGYAVWLAFLASMCAAGLTGLSYASLGARYPKAGGAAFITLEAFGKPFLSYLIGLAVLTSGLTSMATATRVFAGYFNGRFPQVDVEVVMLVFIVVFAAVVFRGIKETMWANVVCTLTEVGGLLFIIFVGAPYVGGEGISYLNAQTTDNPEGLITLPLLLSGAILTFYSFIGFEDILNVSEEVKDPKKNLPIGLLAAVGISSLIYMLISITAVSVVPPMELASSKQPLVDVVVKAAPWMPPSIYSFISMFAVTNTFLLNFVMGSRLLYGMAHQGLVPAALGKVHAKRQTPYVAIFVVLAIVLVLAFSGDVTSLARATSVILLTCFTMVNVALVVFHRKKTDWEGAFRVPTFVPILGAVICIAMLTQAEREEALIAGSIILVIAVLYVVLRPKKVV